MIATGRAAPETPVSAFPWDAVLTLGLSTLRWRPRDVWSATPRELALAAGLGQSRPRSLNRVEFDRLIAAYPDREAPR